MPVCCDRPMRRYGFERSGRQRFQCFVCGITTSLEGRNRPPFNRKVTAVLPDIAAALESGVGLRGVAAKFGINKHTVGRIRQHVLATRKPVKGEGECDYCGVLILRKEVEAYRSKPRNAKHKFCGCECYQAFRREQRSNIMCRRCGEPYKAYSMFARGLCNRCYDLLRPYGFDERKAQLHNLTQDLKREIINGKRYHQHV